LYDGSSAASSATLGALLRLGGLAMGPGAPAGPTEAKIGLSASGPPAIGAAIVVLPAAPFGEAATATPGAAPGAGVGVPALVVDPATAPGTAGAPEEGEGAAVAAAGLDAGGAPGAPGMALAPPGVCGVPAVASGGLAGEGGGAPGTVLAPPGVCGVPAGASEGLAGEVGGAAGGASEGSTSSL
jgi:hypothetical protein